MAEQKTCKQCNAQFTVEDEDLEFYKKISPTFTGKTFEIPSPTLCPICREIRRLVWRNELNLYNRKSDKSGKNIISIYSPDKTQYKVYGIDEWWADDWDATSYSEEFDQNKDFFDQFDLLLKRVPRLALFNTKTENCEYANYIAECRNCYMSSIVYYQTENTHYSYWVYNSKNNIDLSHCDRVDNSYMLTGCDNCYGCMYSQGLSDCRDCKFSFNLRGCNDCLFCSNLSHKQYCIENHQYSKEEYVQRMNQYNFSSRKSIDEYQKKYEQLKSSAIVRYAKLTNCENCLGDDLTNCKNCRYCFAGVEMENCKYCSGISEKTYNVFDSRGGTYEWALETNHTGFGKNLVATSGVLYSSNMYYCENCHSCQDCFGCVGLRNKQYCVLNKQYTKEEYEQKAAQIIEKMTADGEWGEFFPISLSPFAYNESLANQDYPKSKEEAEIIGAKWLDKLYDINFQGEFYVPEDDINVYKDEGKLRELLAGVIKCEVTNRPFKIMPQEAAFYIGNGIPIPTKHFAQRVKEREDFCNPRKLYHRKCMNEGCNNEFETTYAPDRPEKVYCESCYQKSVL